jgi:anaerobic dimethyl sulfoxide reductase subunit B (iron-sulfur subunit)
MKEYTFVVNLEKCSGCYGCVGACKNWRKVELGRIEDDKLVTVRYRRVVEKWYGNFPNTNFRTYSVSCQHCSNPPCVENCPTGSITKSPKTGIVTVEQESCIACQTCLAVCPFGVPQFGKTMNEKMQKCDLCVGRINYDFEQPPCVATCNPKALSLVRLSTNKKLSNEEKLKKFLSV